MHASQIFYPEKTAELKDLKKKESRAVRNGEFSVEEIEELIAQKCPYLPFLQALPFSLVGKVLLVFFTCNSIFVNKVVAMGMPYL